MLNNFMASELQKKKKRVIGNEFSEMIAQQFYCLKIFTIHPKARDQQRWDFTLEVIALNHVTVGLSLHARKHAKSQAISFVIH